MLTVVHVVKDEGSCERTGCWPVITRELFDSRVSLVAGGSSRGSDPTGDHRCALGINSNRGIRVVVSRVRAGARYDPRRWRNVTQDSSRSHAASDRARRYTRTRSFCFHACFLCLFYSLYRLVRRDYSRSGWDEPVIRRWVYCCVRTLLLREEDRYIVLFKIVSIDRITEFVIGSKIPYSRTVWRESSTGKGWANVPKWRSCNWNGNV